MSQFDANYANVHELAAELAFSEAAYARALELAALQPEKRDWLRYVDRFLMALGVALICAGITAFFAWNWADLGNMQKFGLIEFGIVTAAVAAWRLGLDSIAGAASLFAGAFLVGVLFAVYGQIYQTGADPYGLFLAWAILILPWAIVGRQQGLWLLFVMLINLTVIMYWTQVLKPPEGLWQLAQVFGPLVSLGFLVTDSQLSGLVFFVNVFAVVTWEFLAVRGISWMRGHWFVRVVVFVALTTVVAPTLIIILAATFGEQVDLNLLSPILLGCATAGCLYYYQFRQPDLFILTCCLLAVIMVITSLAIRVLLDDYGSMLVLAILLIAQVAGAAYWLRGVARRSEKGT